MTSKVLKGNKKMYQINNMVIQSAMEVRAEKRNILRDSVVDFKTYEEKLDRREVTKNLKEKITKSMPSRKLPRFMNKVLSKRKPNESVTDIKDNL